MNKKIWETCVAFHGHECGGLTIGYQAALYAVRAAGTRAGQQREVLLYL